MCASRQPTRRLLRRPQTLGQRTMQPDALRELIEGKFVDALRTIAAEMTMEEDAREARGVRQARA